ncbi:MAG: hypothetical protein OEN01_01095 [Candidatus Krumholzibacteria bacterium]|nr:hypothetical protein [Candidatus Krumholzibacteria bacterium]
MKIRKGVLASVLAVVLTVCTLVASATAKDANFAIGVRPIGFSTNPDQYTLGVQSVMGRVSRMRFAPSVDFGFGDDVNLTALNFDLKLDLFSPPKASALFYAGLGPTISIISPDQGDTDTEIGLSLVGGIKLPFGQKNYYNLETRFGIGDIPDFKLLIGVMFGFGRVD